MYSMVPGTLWRKALWFCENIWKLSQQSIKEIF
uniref:Uncharacterized protein n=1 Tax=Arundo donax TaxID=35708 RepID=A0A0A8YUJ9_ARUDO